MGGRSKPKSPPRMVVQCAPSERELIRERAERGNWPGYGPLLLELGLRGHLLHPQIDQALRQRAKAAGRTATAELEQLLLAGLKAEAGGG